MVGGASAGWEVGPGYDDSNSYSTASRQASFGPDSFPCCRRLWSVLKHASQAEHECALRRRGWKGSVRSWGGRERERLEDCDDCGAEEMGR